MADFNQVLDAGDVDGGVINVVSEIPQGSQLKIEWDRHKAVFRVDRVEPYVFVKPCGYGFIPQTLDEDGDELDVLIVCNEPIPTGVTLEGVVLGILNFEDDGDMDHKVVVAPADDRHTKDALKTLDDLSDGYKEQIVHHFNHYKDLKKPGSTKVLGWGDATAAKKVIKESQQRWVDEA